MTTTDTHTGGNKNLTFLWCVPRSISTAFEKMMAHSGQYQVVGEPFIDIYKQSRQSAEGLRRASTAFHGVCEDLLRMAAHDRVFVKDMAYHALPFVQPEFLKQVNHTFLIRDPELTIPSLFTMRPDFTDDHPGFEGQYRLYRKIEAVTGKSPLVLDGEQLKAHADVVIPRYFSYLGDPVPEGILPWPQGAREDWQGRESWHTDAIQSTGFTRTHAAAKTAQLPQRVLESIEANKGFYKKLLAQVEHQNA